ncbi:MAG: TetR/AcrR family transcriptional regulator [Rhodoferax sp.]|nr:TetR/AcrR family transcriptional regulator [Rhodoferax sp.]
MRSPATTIPAPDSGDIEVKRPRGRPRKTEDERDDGNRRHELLKAAAQLFRRKGFAATTTRDIAAAAGMQSGSPFYHFKSKDALLYAVMEEGMQGAIARQRLAITAVVPADDPRAQLHSLVRAHFDMLHGSGNDFIPVMLYETRSLNARQRSALAQLQIAYEAAWTPVLQGLHTSGHLRAPVKLSRLLMLGALNWSVQWFDRKKEASLDDLADAAVALFLKE